MFWSGAGSRLQATAAALSPAGSAPAPARLPEPLELLRKPSPGLSAQLGKQIPNGAGFSSFLPFLLLLVGFCCLSS